MTKRALPFEIDFCRQSKIHLNNYENDLTSLKAIEEQTFKKLMNASRNLNSTCNNFVQNVCCNTRSQSRDKNLIQKCVTNYFTVNGKTLKETMNKATSLSDMGNKCFFCDHATNCTYKCSNCQEYYCETCSLAKYDSLEDNRICLSCS